MDSAVLPLCKYQYIVVGNIEEIAYIVRWKKCKNIWKNVLTRTVFFDIIFFVDTERCPSGLRSWSWKPVTRKCQEFESLPLRHFYIMRVAVVVRQQPSSMEKYSRGRRGAPAKGVGRETGARVQIPPSPPNKKDLLLQVFFICLKDLKPSAGYRQEGDVCDRCLNGRKREQ